MSTITLNTKPATHPLEQRSHESLQLPVRLYVQRLILLPRIRNILDRFLVISLNVSLKLSNLLPHLIAHSFGRFVELAQSGRNLIVNLSQFFNKSVDFDFRVMKQLAHFLHAVAELHVFLNHGSVRFCDGHCDDIFVERAEQFLIVLHCAEFSLRREAWDIERFSVDVHAIDLRFELFVDGIDFLSESAGFVLAIDSNGIFVTRSANDSLEIKLPTINTFHLDVGGMMPSPGRLSILERPVVSALASGTAGGATIFTLRLMFLREQADN